MPYQAFETKDGHIILAIGNDAQFSRFCAIAGKPEIAEDDRFRTNESRVIHREQALGVLTPLLKSRTTDEWLAVLGENGVPAGPVNDLHRVFGERAVHRQTHAHHPRKRRVQPSYGGQSYQNVGYAANALGACPAIRG